MHSLEDFVEEKKGFIFDIEGVIVEGVESPRVYHDALELIKHITNQGKRIVFLTNLARVSARRVARLLNRILSPIGCTINEKSVVNPTIAAVEGYLEPIAEKPVRAFLISEGGHIEDISLYDWIELDPNPSAEYVLLGADRTLTYTKLNTAFRILRNGGELIVLGGDLYSEGEIFGEKGEFLMEGAIAKALEAATGVKGIYTGKPSTYAFRTAVKKLSIEESDVVMIGDSFESDIIGAINFGIDAIFINRKSIKIDTLKKEVKDINTTTYQVSDLHPKTKLMELKLNRY